MSDKPIGDRCRRMLQDMAVRQFSDKTRNDYIAHVEALAKFVGRAPDTVTGDDLSRFQFQQIEQGAQPPKMNTQASAPAVLLHDHALARRSRPPVGAHTLPPEVAAHSLP